MKLLLIDNRVRATDIIINSLEEDVDYIIFNYETETVQSLTSQIPIKPYDSVGIVQDQDNIPSYTLAKPMGDYDLNDYSTWTTYIEFVGWCVTNLGIKIWDLIECNIDETWQTVITSLQNQFNITIRSSSKQLGNTNLGDNWVFDDGTSLIGIYFTTAINEYPYILGSGNGMATQYYIDSAGDVWGQGDNNLGQLGQGTVSAYTGFNKVLGLPKKCVQVESTSTGTLFLLVDGTCYACGLNSYYSLGLSTLQTNQTTYTTSNTTTSPTLVSLTGIKYITCGWAQSFFLLTNGDLYLSGLSGWGSTANGISSTNTLQKILSNVLFVKSSRDQTILVFADKPNIIYFCGAIVTSPTWMNNYSNSNFSLIPLNTVNGVNVKSIDCGSYSLYYIDISNNLYAYGYNHVGQLGQGNTTNLTSWTQIKGTSASNTDLVNNVQCISSAYLTLQIMTLDGTYYTCGLYVHRYSLFASTYDITPTDSTSYTTYPVKCLNGSKILGLISWWIFSTAGTISYIDSSNTYSYLSNTIVSGTQFVKSSVVGNYIYAASTTNQIVSQQSSFSLIDSAGAIYVFGTNFYGASNVTSINGYNKVTPATSFGSPVIQVTNTNRGCLVLLQNGDVWAFGYNQYGELGTTVSATLTSPVGSGNGVKLTFAGIGANTIVFIASGLYHSLFVTSSGAVYSCGLNNYGQLGQGNITNLTTPTVISVLSNISKCYCGLYSSYFLNTTGTVIVSGYNFNNEFGNNYKVLGTSTVQSFQLYFLTPVQYNGTNTLFSSGYNHSVTFTTTNILYSGGLNIYGQLGLSNTNIYITYQNLSNIKFSQLFAGENRSAGITSSGSLYTWGRNIGTAPVLTDINVTTVYQVSDIGIIYIKNSKYYVAYASDILASYVYAPIPNIIAYSASTNPLTIYSNICFLEGTPVKCDQGMIEIDKIDPDLHTISLKKIVAITETYSTEKELVLIEKDSLRPNVPNKNTVITMEHKVFYKGKMMEASKITKKRQKYNGEKLYNVLMEEHNKMSVNNMLVETLDPANTIGKVFKGLREYKE